VAFRQVDGRTEIALILVGPRQRWQLPKGLVNRDEEPEQAAQREVREEAGIDTHLLEQLDRIEYWFYATRGGKRSRVHKFVFFYLMEYVSGNVTDHDQEVEEARWVEIEQAVAMLSFDSEKALVRKAHERIQAGNRDNEPGQAEAP
jgi:8-oxo-dGTP pyrophosphatase MutT (NUDIX family)